MFKTFDYIKYQRFGIFGLHGTILILLLYWVVLLHRHLAICVAARAYDGAPDLQLVCRRLYGSGDRGYQQCYDPARPPICLSVTVPCGAPSSKTAHFRATWLLQKEIPCWKSNALIRATVGPPEMAKTKRQRSSRGRCFRSIRYAAAPSVSPSNRTAVGATQ